MHSHTITCNFNKMDLHEFLSLIFFMYAQRDMYSYTESNMNNIMLNVISHSVSYASLPK